MLLFLASLEEPYIARDDAGDPLPYARLDFFAAGTTALQPVYSDSALENEVSQPVIANSAGVFATLYTDPDLTYRVRLKTAAGKLRFDVDPYEIDDSIEGRHVFRTPIVEAFIEV